MGLEEARKASHREEIEMVVDGAPPGASEKAGLEAVRVRRGEGEDAGGSKEASRLVEKGSGLVEMLDEVGRVDELEATSLEASLFEGCGADIESKAGDAVGCGLRACRLCR